MSLIRKRRNVYAFFFAASICLAVWLGATFMLEAGFAIGVISTISLMLLVRQCRLLYYAILICDNSILAVPSALISSSDWKMKKNTLETIVSTFGILIGSEVYCWGLNGVHGVRLHATRIDQKRICLTFGDTARTIRVELLHGMTEKQEVLDTSRKLLYETGITADIIGW